MRDRWGPVQARYPRAVAKLERFCDPVFFGTRELSWKGALGDSEGKLDRAVASAAATLRALPVGAAELELGNLIEQVVLEVLGEPKATCSFLLSCFRGGSDDIDSSQEDPAPTAEARERFETRYGEAAVKSGASA